MKTPLFILTFVLTFGLLTIATTSEAAKAAKPTAAEKTTQRAAKQSTGIKKATLKDINLTADQKQKVKELQDQQREKTQLLRDDFEKKLEAILTPEQLTKFKELNAKSAPATEDQPAQTTPQAKRKKAAAPARNK